MEVKRKLSSSVCNIGTVVFTTDVATPTDHAVKAKIILEDGCCLWWLRSPGHGQGFASVVWPVGGVDTAGSGVGRPADMAP